MKLQSDQSDRADSCRLLQCAGEHQNWTMSDVFFYITWCVFVTYLGKRRHQDEADRVNVMLWVMDVTTIRIHVDVTLIRITYLNIAADGICVHDDGCRTCLGMI